ncbi:MAG: bifunctional 23S rRNA (guanine(2069)-N(7))-methyltransferase RlmK/23S rRNA (guanine(2445)-N(2))-methyltransferase RlmL [Pirellulales bacterium]|nr:bifunctional 23S rRNA (guanine(2069)-N(7))-methyltransferase RlmK/23S rRNA (guanine(2445)-N(2))-methyltransferase RlmL [Pirellulales bacterium]
MVLDLIATSTMGLEAVLARELAELGYENRIIDTGQVFFQGDTAAICRTNLWLRTAGRVLLQIGSFEATDFDQLFERTRAIGWEEWLPADAAFPVSGRSRKSKLSSVPACQRTVKKAIVEKLTTAHGVSELPETGSAFAVEVRLVDDQVQLLLDTSGAGLHKRGYRPLRGTAPLRETLAAGLVLLSFWKPGRPFVDPFCGSGTIPIEAALIGRNLAPGRHRNFAAESWPRCEGDLWQEARSEAADLAKETLEEAVIGQDISGQALSQARHHANLAQVTGDVHFQRREFSELSSKRQYGCLITNPPYAHNVGTDREVAALYRSMPDVLRRLPTWSHSILTAYPGFETLVGQSADRRRKLYNSRIECTYFQFHGPRQPKAGVKPLEAPTPAFGGVSEKAEGQAEIFRNRLAKRARHLRRWPARRGITCYRLYDRDIPEVPLVVDRYEDYLHITEYERPHEHTPAEHGDWLDLMARTAGVVLEIPRTQIFLKKRGRQRGTQQHDQVAEKKKVLTVAEGDLKFQVNLSDYIDTGLFLDHRITRTLVREAAGGCRFLNLFGYTGAFTVYAIDGGAAETTTVDLSQTYLDWTARNLAFNGMQGPPHRMIRSDAMTFLEGLPLDTYFDLAVVDPPTFSNSKRTENFWEVQRDHAALLNRVLERLVPGGILFFSTNFRQFKLNEAAIEQATVREISRQTIPEDFRNKRIHRCWRMVRIANA